MDISRAITAILQRFSFTTYRRSRDDRGSLLFYKDLVLQHIDDPEMTEDPFVWAYKRAEKAFSFVVSDDRVETTWHYITRSYPRIARLACNTHDSELDQIKEFKTTEKSQKILEALHQEGLGDSPETVYLLLSIQDSLDETVLRRKEVRKNLRKMPAWVARGLNINRLEELFRMIKTKTGEEGKYALSKALKIIDRIFIGNTPWYFRENFDFKKIFYGTKILVMDPDDAMDIIMQLAKESGPDFEHAIKAYFTNETGKKLEEKLSRTKTVQVIATLTKHYGIGNSKRVGNIIELLNEILKKIKTETERNKFLEIFLTHAIKEREGDAILTIMQGEEAGLHFPSIEDIVNVACVVDEKGDDHDDQYDFEFHELQVGPEIFEFIQEQYTKPHSVRSAINPNWFTRRYRTIPFLMTTSQIPALSAPDEEEVAKEVDIKKKIFEFYSQAREEIGYIDKKAITLYFSIFALKMPDPFAPTKGLLKTIKAISEIPDTKRISNRIFGQREEYDDQVPKEFIRTGALLQIICAWLEGIVPEQKLQEVFKYLRTEDLEIEREETFQEFLGSNNRNHKEEGSLEMEEMKYDKKSEEAKSTESQSRMNNLVRHMIAYREFIEAAQTLGLSVEQIRHLMPGMIETMLTERKTHIRVKGENLQAEIERYEYETFGAIDMDHLSDFDPDDITLATLFGGDESKVEEKFREFVNTKFSNIGELFGTGAKSITKMIAELRKYPLVEEAIGRLKEDLKNASSPQEKEEIIMGFYSELKLLHALQTITQAFFRHTEDHMDKQGLVELEDDDGGLSPAKWLQTDGLTKIELAKLQSFSTRFGLLEQVLDQRLDSDQGMGGFKYMPISLTKQLIEPVKRLKETLAIIASISDIRRIVDKNIKPNVPVPEGTDTSEEHMTNTVREATRTTLSIVGTVSMMVHQEQMRQLIENDNIPDNVRLLPGAKTLSVLAQQNLPEGELVPIELKSTQEIRQLVRKKMTGDLPTYKNWLERIRTEDLGYLPVGAKVHVLHPVNEQVLETIKRLLGLESTPFRLIHAEKSIIIPPMVTAKELAAFLFCIQQLGIIDTDYPELQICGPGRLSKENAAITGSAMLLSTEVGKKYKFDAFLTTHESTGTRMMTYDYGQCDPNFPYMKRKSGEVIKGRTDIQGRLTITDIETYKTLYTLVLHMQEDMVFSDIGKWFVGKYRKILQRHGMADVLEADWVLTPGKAESLDENNPDQIKHFEAITKCTDMYFECAESKNEVVHEVRELTGQAEEMIREKQEEIAADPKQHKAIMEDFKIALDF